MGKACKGGIDGLFFRTDKANCYLPFLECKDLGSQHGRIGDADELELLIPDIITRYYKEPGPVRRTVHVRGLNLSIDVLFLLGEVIKVHLSGRGKGFDDIFEGITVHSVQEVHNLNGYLRIGKKEGIDISLAQILRNRIIIGKITVVNEGLVETDKRMSAAGMPYSTLGWIALVGNPEIGVKILQFIVLGDLFRIPHNLEDHHIAAMGQDKSLLVSQGAVEGKVQLVGILVYKFLFSPIKRDCLKVAFRAEGSKGFGLDTDKIAFYRGRFYIQPGNIPVIIDGFEEALMIDPEMGSDKTLLHFRKYRFIEQCNLEKKILIKGFLIYPQFRRGKAHCGKTSAFPVPAVVHLHRRRKDMPSAHGNAAGKSRYAAAALFDLHVLLHCQSSRRPEVLSCIDDCLRYLFSIHTHLHAMSDSYF